MKFNTLTFILLLFLFLIVGSSNAQPSLDYVDQGNGLIDFTIRDLSQLGQHSGNPNNWNDPPFYQALLMYGNGNFIRMDLNDRPIKDDHPFDYEYRDLYNDMPVFVQLIARKDDDPPPPSAMILIPNYANTYVEIRTDAENPPPKDPIYSNEIKKGKPIVPMIPAGRSVALGFSHYAEGDYFLEENTVHTFPIAYQPEGDKGILLFFYSGTNEIGDNTIREGFRYYDEIVMSNNSTPIGTMIPNYYPPESTNGQFITKIDNVVNKMVLVQNYNIDDPYISNITIPLNHYYNKCLAHKIFPEEVQLLNTEVQAPEGSVGLEAELRLFHFIETESFNRDLLNSGAEFLVVLYDGRSTPNENLSGLNDLFFGNPFPNNFSGYNFADFDTLKINKGEPDDPGGLYIRSICNCCEHYIIEYELIFCNDKGATKPAPGADIFIQSYQSNDGTTPIATEFELLSSCVLDDSNSELDPCQMAKCQSPTPDHMDDNLVVKYCYTFDSLYQQECGSILFSVKIDRSDIGRLISQPILEYCVRFHGLIEGGDFCQKSNFLQDSLCLLNGENGGNCGFPNPVWEDRNQKCRDPLFSIYNCPRFICLDDLQRPAGIAGGIVAIVLIGFLLGRFLRSR